MTRNELTDGSTEQIRDSRDVRHSDDEVRHLNNPDGRLWAYREGDEHVVVSRGDEPQTQWTKRVPAEREAVVEDEHLWTIPDNWEHRVNVDGAGNRRFAIYHIPESGVDVELTVPKNSHLVDKWYGVRTVGQLEVTYDDAIAWGELETLIENSRDIDEVSDAELDALERLHRRRRSFELEFEAGVDEFAEETLFAGAHEPVSVDEWTAEPWGDVFAVKQHLGDFLNIDDDDDLLDDVMQALNSRSIIPSYPTVRVGVDGDAELPNGYHIQGLTEAGCSPPQAVDYHMTEIVGKTQAAWSEVRDIAAPSVSSNVSEAKRHLGIK